MAGSLGNLLITLTANTAQLQSDFGRAAVVAETNAKRMDRAFSQAGDSLRAIGRIAIGAGIAAAARNLIAYADDIGTLSEKTGAGVEALQGLRYAAEQADVPFESVAKSIQKLQRNLSEAANGNRDAAKAFAQLGLSVTALKNQRAENAFKTVIDAISALKSEADRSKAAVDAFGRSGEDLGPLFQAGAAGINAAERAARNLNLIRSPAEIARVRELGDNVSRLGDSFKYVGLSILDKVSGPLTWFLDVMREGINPTIEEQIKLLEKRQRAADTYYNGRPIDTQLKELRFEQNAPLRRGSINRQPAAGSTFKDTGLSPEEVAAGWAKIYAARDKAAAAAERERAEIERLFRSTLTGRAKAIQEVYDLNADLDRLVAAGAITIEERYTRLAARVKELLDQLNGEPIKKATLDIAKQVDTLGERARTTAERMEVFSEEAARNMQDYFAEFLFDPFKGGLKGMLTGFVNTLRRMVAEAAAAEIFKALFSGETKSKKGGGFLGTLLGAVVGGFGGGKAVGGPVSGGMSYLVGEKGPELLTMGRGSSGNITPNDKLGAGGGVQLTQYVTYSGLGLSAEQVFLLQQRNNQDLIRRLSDANRRAGLPAPRF